MTVRLWKGYHGPELAALIRKSWRDGHLLVLCPPLLVDFSFLQALPAGDLEIYGQWTELERLNLRRAQRAPSWPAVPVPVIGVFTSGTLSSSPRLVLYTRENVLASLSAIFSLFDLSRIEHVFCYPQAFHTFGLTLGYLAAEIYGWHLHTPSGKYQRGSHGVRIALQEKNLLTLGTPTHFFDLLAAASASSSPMPSYACIMGGASVSRDLWTRVQRDLRIEAPSIGYGCTEASPGITHLPPGQYPLGDDEIGYPLSSLASRIVDDGVEIAGPSLGLAIVQNGLVEFPEKQVIRDRIQAANDGRWYYRGRLDLLMNRGGAKFSLEDIEKTLYERLGLTAVACTVRDSRLGEDLGLALLQDEAAKSVVDDAAAVLREVFSLKLQPGRTKYLPEMPLNECSKLDRKSVWTLFQEESTIP